MDKGPEAEMPTTRAVDATNLPQATEEDSNEHGSTTDVSTEGNNAVQQTEEKSKPSANDHSSIPNGGLLAWLQVLSAFMAFFNTWGILNTFGVFQTYYESGDLFQASSSNISWIGALQAYFVLLGGMVSGPFYDRGYLRALLIVGSFGVVFGHMMLSLCHEYWQALLAQGFCVGLGAGMLFVPALAVIPTYFNTKLGLAIGLAASGSSFGGIIYPIAFYKLLGQIGFAWSVRVLGFIALATSLLPIVFMKMRVKPPKARAFFDASAFVDVPYITFVFGAIVGFTGLYVTLFYQSYFGQANKITDESMSFYLVPILNAASMFGRTLPNWLSDKVGPLNLIIPGAIICGALNLAMLGVKSLGAIVVVAILYGFFSGVFIALPPVVMVMLTKDRSRIGTRIGQGFALIGFGALAGGPGGGGVLQRHGELLWDDLWIYAGVMSFGSGAIFLFVRYLKAGLKLNVKT